MTVVKRSGVYHAVFTFQGRQVWRSTHCGEVAEAKRRAKVIKEEYVAAWYRNKGEAPSARLAAPVARVGEVIEAYLAWPKASKASTARRNVAALREVVSTGLGVQDPDRVSVAELTRELAWQWMAKRQGAAVVDRRRRVQGNVAINSTFAKAVDVFAKRYRDEGLFKGLAFPPELDEFLGVGSLPTPKQGWRPWAAGQFEAMCAAADGHEDGELRFINVMFRRFGLRAQELKAAAHDWVRFDNGCWSLWVEDYPERPGLRAFSIKGALGRVLSIPEDLVAELVRRKEAGGYLVPGARIFRRDGDEWMIEHAGVDGAHVAFVRPFSGGRQKPNHELRKIAGSMVYSTRGAEAAKWFLGHGSIATTESWYAHYLGGAAVEVDQQREVA